MNAQDALNLVKQRQDIFHQDRVRESSKRLKESLPIYKGVINGKHAARKSDGSMVYANQSRLITGGAIKIGSAVSAFRPSGSQLGFIDGMQRG